MLGSRFVFDPFMSGSRLVEEVEAAVPVVIVAVWIWTFNNCIWSCVDGVTFNNTKHQSNDIIPS